MIARLLLFALGLAACAEEISIPLLDGTLVIRDARFIRMDDGTSIPELYFKIENHTSLPWWSVRLRFEIAGTCGATAQHWAIPATISVGFSDDHIVGNLYRERYEPLEGHVDGCQAESFKPVLLVAENADHRIVSPEQAKREAAEAAERRRRDREAVERDREAVEKAADERRKTREACSGIYRKTVDKKIGDLTVREEQEIQSCRSLGFYQPSR